MSMFKQPLVHFLLLGALVCVGYEWRAGAAVTLNDTSFVSRDSFIEFIQYRHRGVNKAAAQQLIKAMTTAQKTTFLKQHIKEEILYREAITLGLNEKDYVIKQRLIQKMEYLLGDEKISDQALSSKAVADYFERNKQRYFISATVTFTHVFIDAAHHSQADAIQMAEALNGELKQNKVPFEHASRYGERFVYFTNYVERDESYVASHFGPAFTKAVFSSAATGQWQGPVASDHGQHLVWVAKLKTGGLPELSKVYRQVAQNLQQDLLASQLESNIQILLNNYNIDVAELEAEL